MTDEELLSRATELDVLEAILPFNRRDQLAGLLTKGAEIFTCNQ